MKKIFKAIIGLLLAFIFHVPRLAYQFLLLSYAYVFNRHENLTADPKEHLKRAKKLLSGYNSRILYAALEIRFAIERITQHDLIFAEKATSRSLKEYNPVKKVKSLRRLDPNTEFPHKIIFNDEKKGIQFDWGKYKPLDIKRVKQIEGRLGNLLHPKDGIKLGVYNDPWYLETRKFLLDSIEYLSQVIEDNTPFFGLEGLNHIRRIRINENDKLL
ncbi:MAG: hypothetical protein ACTSQK_10825 [Candidatus Heimdallarchaeota archaeon]